MTFLAILIAVFFYRNWFGENPVQKLAPFPRYLSWFIDRNLATHVRYFLCVGLPALLVLVLMAMVGDWLLGLVGLAISLLVLIYAIELFQADSIFGQEIVDLRSISDQAELADVVQRQEDFIVLNIYEMFQSIVPVLFWFLLAGPAAALFYALSIKYLDCLDQDDPEVDLVEQFVYWLEWLPMRITGLLFAFVGNFGTCFDYWLRELTDTQESQAVHLATMAQISVAEFAKPDSESTVGFARFAESSLHELRSLCDRALFGWLGIAAIVTIAGW